MKQFDKNNHKLCNQFNDIEWIEETGISEVGSKILADKVIEACFNNEK